MFLTCPLVRPFLRQSVPPSVRPSVRPFVSCEHEVPKTSGPILMQIATSGPWDTGMKRSTLGVRRLRVMLGQEVEGQAGSGG